jgi:endonuclease III
MSDSAALARRALAERGPHAAARAGLDLSAARDRAQWLALARLLSERAGEEIALEAFARVAADPGADPDALAAAGPARVAAALRAGGLPKPEPVAASLCRAAAALCERHRGDLDALAGACDGLEELGARLAQLAPGFGTATVLRYLRPLRDTWTAARETPLAEPARAAAIHLGLLGVSEDLEGEPAALRAACARAVPDLSPIDVEAALERLGAAACRANRPDRCPFGAHCPGLAKSS